MAIYKLNELGNFKNGANYPKGSYGKGIKIVNVKDLFTPRYVNLSELVELKPGTLKNENDYLIKENDILFSRSSLVQSGAGMCALAHNIKEKTLFCGFIIRYRITRTDVVNPLFLLYLMRTPMYRKIFTGTQQTNIANINQENLGQIEIDLPPIETQNKIVGLLSALDDKVDINNEINTELEFLSKTVYDYWFLQFEFPDENGKPYKSSGGKMVWNEDLKREIPDGWSCGSIGDLFPSQSGYAFKSSNWTPSGHPVLTIKAIKEDGSVNMEDSSYISSYDSSLEKYSVCNGNMIFAMSGNTIGKIGIIASNKSNVLINQRVLIIKTQTCSMAFPYFTIKDKNIQNNIVQLGANSAQPNISEEALRSIKICVPKKSILERYNNYCACFFEKIIHNRIENQELSELRDFLLPLLMNGQVTFKDKLCE